MQHTPKAWSIKLSRYTSMTFTTLSAQDLDAATAYRLLTGIVVPRPIAWVTTINAQGVVNAAPFSSYNYVAHSPPMVAINISSRAGEKKDTARNIDASGEFVVNVTTLANMELMHLSSADFAPEESETTQLGIALLPSRHVLPPRIELSPIQMECRLHQAVVLGDMNTLYIGQVVAFHLSSSVYDGRYVDSAALQPVGRLGGPVYAAMGERIVRPVLQSPAVAEATKPE
jgi:flavin reductase (DIM6/NTAB) family NADH-FMN oxidoreductase RutF